LTAEGIDVESIPAGRGVGSTMVELAAILPSAERSARGVEGVLFVWVNLP